MSTSSSNEIRVSDAPRLAGYSLQDPDHPEIELAQAEHRIRLVNLWDIKPGSRILELGCGQGNATTILAEAAGPAGHVDAVDPGALDYGAPFTLAQAQDHISAGPVGARVSWHQATPESFLESESPSGDSKTWDVAVLSHCIWYFADVGVLKSILTALKGRVTKLCIAEYALHATEKAAAPHVLAVVARGLLESFRPESDENVRTPVGPRAITEIAAEAGWGLEKESTLVPDVGLLDGSWEAGTVMSKYFVGEVEKEIPNERTRVVIMTARDAVVNQVKALDGAKVQTMDVWVSVFA